jgi:hypothetical protein
MTYLRWAGCRVVFSYNSTYEKLDDNITGTTIIKFVCHTVLNTLNIVVYDDEV